ncbi:MAG TPA: hypothetical protein DIV41_04545 [Ruminococcaceae bacterium]|nr:hypothetical protein [Oscillospiraceae bacterium]
MYSFKSAARGFFTPAEKRFYRVWRKDKNYTGLKTVWIILTFGPDNESYPDFCIYKSCSVILYVIFLHKNMI